MRRRRKDRKGRKGRKGRKDRMPARDAARTFPIAGFHESHECACGYRSMDNRERRRV